MTDKITYPLLDMLPLELWRYRKTLFELLKDSGFRLNLKSSPQFPLEMDLDPRAFQANYEKVKAAQMTQLQQKIAQAPHDLDTFDPLVEICSKNPDLKDDCDELLERLGHTFEQALFLYAEQDGSHISNSTTAISPLLNNQARAFTYDQAKQKMAVDPVPQPPRSILIAFCRQASVLKEAYLDFQEYLELYGISDGIILSADGASSKIQKSLNECPEGSKNAIQGPNIRILAIKATLFYNKARLEPNIPLYRRLNPLEVAFLELRYGSRDNFPKLLRSKPVSAYYGFRVGDVVLVATTWKRFHKYDHVQDYIEAEMEWIEPFKFVIVTDDQLNRK